MSQTSPIPAPASYGEPGAGPDRGPHPAPATNHAVAVIIPTYNRGRLVLRAALSALFQTLPPAEIIIVDDCSTDDTERVCGRLAEEAARFSGGRSAVRYFKLARNSGANAARNRGLAEARSRYVAFLDSDDIWHPEKLAKQFEEIDGFDNPAGQPIFSYTGRMRVDDGFRLLARQTASRVRLAPRLKLSNVFGTLSSILTEKKLIDAIGGFDEGLKACQDWDLFLRAVPKSVAVGIADPLIMYFDGDFDRITRSPRSRLESHIKIYKKHLRGRVDNAQLSDLYFNIAEALAALGRGRCATRFYAFSLKPTYRITFLRRIVARLTWRRLPKMRYERYGADLKRGEANEAYKGENAAYLRDYRAAVEKYDGLAGEIIREGT